MRWRRRALSALALASTAALLVPSTQQAMAADAPVDEAGPTTGLFSDTTIPSEARLDSDSRSVEIGVRFTPEVDGTATGVQVYKASSSTSATPRTGTLWDSSGRPIASAEFAPTARTGWLSVDFSSAVPLEAGDRYTVSVFAPNGRYAATQDYFQTDRTTERLTAPAGSNGVYRYGATSGFPADSFRSSNYWVDVAFRAGSSSSVEHVASGGEAAPVKPTEPTPPAPKPEPSPTVPAPGTGSTTTPSVPDATSERFPTAATAGLPAGWTPKRSVTGNYTISTPGAVVEDLRVTNGMLQVNAPNVTLRRVEVLGGGINNYVNGTCHNGLLIEDTTVARGPGQTTSGDWPAIGTGGYTARNVEINGLPEGFRVGGKPKCGPVTIEDSFAKITAPDVCNDWHGDGLQGYDGPALTLRNTTLLMEIRKDCGGTAPFFYPHSQGNTSVDIDGLLVSGGGYPFRLGMPGPVRDLNVVDGSWVFGPVNVKCSAVSGWDAQVVRLDAAGQPVPVRDIGCNMENGN